MEVEKSHRVLNRLSHLLERHGVELALQPILFKIARSVSATNWLLYLIGMYRPILGDGQNGTLKLLDSDNRMFVESPEMGYAKSMDGFFLNVNKNIAVIFTNRINRAKLLIEITEHKKCNECQKWWVVVQEKTTEKKDLLLLPGPGPHFYHTYNELCFNVEDHVDVPSSIHKMSHAEFEEVKEKHRIKKSQLGIISHKDPLAISLGARKGQIIHSVSSHLPPVGEFIDIRIVGE